MLSSRDSILIKRDSPELNRNVRTGNRVACKPSAISDHISIIIIALTTSQSYVVKITHLSYPWENQF